MAMQRGVPVGVAAFIGRARERAKVADLLAESRVVTLTGSGGCGKTRLAVEVAGDVAARFTDGARWVDLQAVSEPALVAHAVGAAVDVRERPGQALADTLVEQLQEQHLLVVLDNCEHLVQACAELVGKLSATCPQVHVLATSRVPLLVEGEATLDVAGLPLPDPGPFSASTVAATDAARLFEVRARQVAADFRIGDDNAGAVAEICRRLDGIPLAIELAAARVRVLAPSQIASGLADRFGLLTGGARGAPARQRTLEASLDWSYDLLDDGQGLALARLSVFAGSFELDAAEAVVGADGIDDAVLDLVTGLVEQSMVQVVEGHGRARYRLLETVRVYARQRLADLEAVSDRHLAFYVELAGRARQSLTSDAPGPWMTRLAADIDDLRAAMDWAADRGDLRGLVGITEPIVRFWWEHSMSREMHRRLHEAALAPGVVDSDRAQGLLTAGALAFAGNELTRAYRSADPAVEAARAAEDDGALARSLAQRAVYGALSGRSSSGQLDADVEHAAQLAQRCAEAPTHAYVLALAGAALLHVRSIDEGCRLFEQAAEVCEDNDLAYQLPAALAGPVMWSPWSARLDQTELHAQRAVELSRQVGRSFWEATGLNGLGAVALLRGDHGQAREWLTAVQAVLRAQSLEDSLAGTWVRHWLALSAYASGDLQSAWSIAEEIVRIGAGGGNRWDQSVGEWLLGVLALNSGHTSDARAHLGASRDLSTDTPFPFSLGRSMLGLAELAAQGEEPEEAWDLSHDGLALLDGYADRVGTAAALEQIADLLVAQGDPSRALRLLAATQRFHTDTGVVRFPAEAERFGRVRVSARSALAPNDATASWNAGHNLTLDEAVSYARRGRGERQRPQTGWASLTPVEGDVVRLVAGGHTNAEIGRRLFISVNTVKKHLSHVYAKVEVDGRADLAAQVARRDL